MTKDPSGTVVVLGEHALVKGYPLAGAALAAAETQEDVRRAWAAMPETVGVVILTPSAAEALGAARTDLSSPMSVILPS
jgi:vacuolar-type H+-ATPase subunit F/Vma7